MSHYSYSFALYPTNAQPSGHVHFNAQEHNREDDIKFFLPWEYSLLNQRIMDYANTSLKDDKLQINPQTCDLEELSALCSEYESVTFQFKDAHNHGIGSGADRHCKTVIMSRIVDQYFQICNIYFIIPKQCIKKVMYLIKLCINSGITFNKHLHPVITREFINRDFTLNELLYYLNYIDSTIHNSIQKLDSIYKTDDVKYKEDIDSTSDSLYDAVKPYVLNMTVDKELTKNLDFGALLYNDAIELDNILSGKFVLTHEVVLSICDIEDKYKNMWHEFVKSLNQKELNNMLFLFTGVNKITSNINICVQDVVYDLKISACFYKVIISSALFTSSETLSKLRIYLVDPNDIISG